MIQGYFDEHGRPMLGVHVTVLGPGDRGNTDFLVSTGSAATILSSRDAEYLQIRYGDQGEGETLFTNQYGQTVFAKKVPVVLTLNEGLREHRFEKDILVARPGTMEYQQPSVLGWDVLQHLDMTMEFMSRRLEFEVQ